MELRPRYADFLDAQMVTIPLISLASAPEFFASLIAEFLDRARLKRVMVIRGSPTTFNDIPIPGPTLKELASFFAAHGQRFVQLPSHSHSHSDRQYPRACFFDMPYHLKQECQVLHSMEVGRLLKATLSAMPPDNS